MIHVAMISGWHVHAKGYAQEFLQHEDVRIEAVWDELSGRGQAWARELDAQWIADYPALLAREDIDAVCVCAPTNMHQELLVMAARAGKHIFCEKVLAPTASQARCIAAAVEGSGVVFTISFPFRCNPLVIWAKETIASGQLGRISCVRVRNAHNGASADWLPAHFYDPQACCGGAMMDLGAHPMYLLSDLLGEPKQVSAIFTNLTGHAVEDNCASLIGFANGAIGISETSFVSEKSPFSLEVYGTAGTLMIQDQSAKVALKGQEGWTEPAMLPAALPSAISQFVTAVKDPASPSVFGMRDAVALSVLMDAAYRSYQLGQTVECDSI